MICELCGKETKKLIPVKIEGTVLKVCPSCAVYGQILKPYEEREIIKTEEIIDKELDIVDNYAEIIRKAREQMGLSLEEFCKKFGLKESIMRRIERGELKPSFDLARKLEKILKVKLIEVKKYHFKVEKKEKEKVLTLADVVEIKE